MEKNLSFKDLGLSPKTLAALEKKGFEEPTPIQAETIPLLLNAERDIVGQAQTGTGKTAAFGIPLLERLEGGKSHVQALVLTPTRELAVQVSEEINSLKGRTKMFIAPVYGGASMSDQLRKLRKGVDIVVGTPGRVIDHIKRGSLKLDKISYLILDEADEMLNMGFVEDIEEIVKAAGPERKMLLFSATMPREILTIAEKYMGKYDFIKVKNQNLTTDLTEQIYFEVRHSDKFEALCRIIDVEEEFYGLVFCRTKVDVDTLSRKLIDRGYDSDGLHGDISQHQRERILRKFKKRHTNILVATDVAARGIDINDLTHVINFALPQDPESYVHRIGRTGRAGKEGTAITFVTPEEYRKLLYIQRIAKAEIKRGKLPKVEEVIEAKKTRIREDLSSVLEEGGLDEYVELAEGMYSWCDQDMLVAALLKYSFGDELDENKYGFIKEFSKQDRKSKGGGKVSVDKAGRARLFVALGRQDDMHPRKLVDFIKDKAGVEPRKIQGVRIFDTFSFITVPFEEAEIILQIFKKEKTGRRPIVQPAKEKKSNR